MSGSRQEVSIDPLHLVSFFCEDVDDQFLVLRSPHFVYPTHVDDRLDILLDVSLLSDLDMQETAWDTKKSRVSLMSISGRLVKHRHKFGIRDLISSSMRFRTSSRGDVTADALGHSPKAFAIR